VRIEGAPGRALHEAAKGLEAILFRMLLKSMRATAGTPPARAGGAGRDLFVGLMDQTLARGAAEVGRGLGFAELLRRRYEGDTPGSGTP
jgi:Rod binding domain-containing protein